MNHVIDANSMLNLVRRLKGDAVKTLEGTVIPSLAYYEIGNGLWKECNQLKTLSLEEADKTLSLVGSILKSMKVIHLEDESKLAKKVLQLANKQNITYYDATYLTIASHLEKTLVTDDEKLGKIAEKVDVKIMNSSELIKI